MRWLEARGVVGFYSAGDGGAGAIRPWRNGQRLTTNMWAFPVTPLGRYATFEEFEEFGVSDATALQWWLDLQSFAVNQRTTRLFYNHPPGARGHLSVVQPFLTRANSLQAAGKFKFYTMAELADFSQRRLATSWTKTTTAGVASFNASNASSLSQMTWLLPITRYNTPAVTAGSATVSSDAQNWVVTATSGAVLRFIAQEK